MFLPKDLLSRKPEGGAGYLPLLKGRTAEVITTMDTPKLVYHLIYRAPGHNAMRRSLLEFCGFEMSAMSAFGPVKSSTPEQRERWLASARERGERLRNGALAPGKKFRIKAFAWFRAIRFQFYPMTLVAYAAGAWAANSSGYSFDAFLFWTGYGWLFFLEVATVLINEYVDYKTDNNNHYFGPFTGGSRVIVDRSLTFNDVKKGILISLVLAVAFLAVLLVEAPAVRREIVLASLVLTVLALGYTAPPLKLAYRGLGELTVGITHSFAVILCGYLFMGGKIGDALPWLLGLPLFLAVLPSITLAGIPDYEADKLAGKRTIAVRFGKKAASVIALGFACTSLIATISLSMHYKPAFEGILYFAVPNIVLLLILIRRYFTSHNPPKRIDGLLITSLVYLIWFGLIPLINLWK